MSVEVWPITLSQPLPEVPELSPALVTVYEQAAYELSVDHTGSPPPPVLSHDDEKWMGELPRRVI